MGYDVMESITIFPAIRSKHGQYLIFLDRALHRAIDLILGDKKL